MRSGTKRSSPSGLLNRLAETNAALNATRYPMIAVRYPLNILTGRGGATVQGKAMLSSFPSESGSVVGSG
jgi:hypothetical protein